MKRLVGIVLLCWMLLATGGARAAGPNELTADEKSYVLQAIQRWLEGQM